MPGESRAELDYMTADEVVQIYRWSRSYVYKLAHERGWRRYRGRDRRMRYHRGDVDDTAHPPRRGS